MQPLAAVFQILIILLNVYEVILLLRVLMSWIRVDPYTNPFARLLYNLTDPILDPIRNLLPTAGMIDFSPIVAFLLIFALQRVLSILAAGL
jgi:YggT family protein